MGKRKINIGLVGLGRIGKMHAKNICQSLPSFNLKSIVDPDPDIEFAPNLEGAIISDIRISDCYLCGIVTVSYVRNFKGVFTWC